MALQVPPLAQERLFPISGTFREQGWARLSLQRVGCGLVKILSGRAEKYR